MPNLISFLTLSTLLALTLISAIAWTLLLTRLVSGFFRSTKLPEFEPSNESPVTVIVPMRNEAQFVDDCLTPLLAEPAISKVIVVDDNSTDGTWDRVMRHAVNKLELISPAELPHGWSGKSNACYAAALRANSEWLLFRDADTFVAPDLVSRSISLAKKKKLDAVTCFGGLRCRGTWDKIAVPFYFGLLNSFIKFGGGKENRKSYFIGSFILIKREEYFRIGGHAAVANELVEDKALSDIALKAGLRIGMVFVPKLLSTEWAPGFRNGTSALSREIFPQMRSRPSSSAGFAFALTLLFVLPILAVILSFAVGPPFRNLLAFLGILPLTLEVLNTAYAGRIMQLGKRYLLYSLLFLLPEIVFLWVLWSSVLKLYTVSEIRWRGRAYQYARANT